MAVATAMSIAAAGCQHVQPGEDSGQTPPRRLREQAMNNLWQNRRFSELLVSMGEPLLIMTIPGGGNPPGFAVVYGRDAVTGCIDAFALVYEEDPMIRAYHCR